LLVLDTLSLPVEIWLTELISTPFIISVKYVILFEELFDKGHQCSGHALFFKNKNIYKLNINQERKKKRW